MTDSRLIQAVQELDPGTRALLDLSLRRAIPDERVAGLLGVDLAEIPRRRARGIAQLADKLAVPGPAELAALLVAIPDLPEEAWGVPNPKLPKVKKVSAARRAKAFRRAAVAASPLVAAAAVLAAVIVSGGGGGQKSANLTLSNGSAAGGKHAPAAVAKAPAKSVARPALPHGAEVASAEGPSPATRTKARKAAAARHRRQRARARRHHQHVVNTVPVSDNFASSAPRPDAYVPPPKPKHKEHKQHPKKHQETQPETPPTTTTPEVQTPTTTTPQVVASPPTQQVTTTTPDNVLPPKQEGYKKPAVPVQPQVQTPPQQPSGHDGSNGGGCGHGGGDDKPQGDGDHKWQGGDQKSSVFKTRRELSRQRYGWSQD
jgi:hypothetical protein